MGSYVDQEVIGTQLSILQSDEDEDIMAMGIYNDYAYSLKKYSIWNPFWSGDSYGQQAQTKDDSNMTSGSALIGYQGMVLNKAEILIKSGAKGQNFSNLRHISKTLQMTKYAGRGLGVLGIGVSVIEDINSNNVGWGTVAKVGIGGLLLGVSAPFALTYAVLDVGWGLATGTTITDNVANYVNKKMK